MIFLSLFNFCLSGLYGKQLGYLGSIKCASLRLFFVILFNQSCVNSFSFKKVTSFPKVAANKSCGKASGDERLNLNYGCDNIISDNIG